MATIYDVYPNELIEKAAEKLKEIPEINAPEWAGFVKTGVHKERPPVELDWWYYRAAAILRSVYKLGPIGVNKLRTKYGGKQRRGHKPSRFKKGSGNIIRKCLQQLEKSGLIINIEKGQHKGRKITSKGVSFLDKIAVEIVKAKPKLKNIEIPKKETKKKSESKQDVKKEEKPEAKKEKHNKEKKENTEKPVKEKKAKEIAKPEVKEKELPKKEAKQEPENAVQKKGE